VRRALGRLRPEWNPISKATFRVLRAVLMTEPTEDQVLLKAKQLAGDEGRLRLWGSGYDQLRKAQSRIADDALRAEYLNRLELPRREKI
jgi:hypothetical protein